MFSVPLVARAARFGRSRALSGVVFSVVGKDRPGLVSEVSAIIASAGGNVTKSSSFALGPVFSMAVLADLGADVLAKTTAKIQATVPCHAVSAHPADEDVAAPAFAANLAITCADGVGLIATVTEYVAKSGLSLAKLETASEGAPHGGATLFSLTGVMTSDVAIDEDALQEGFADLETTMGISIDYARL